MSRNTDLPACQLLINGQWCEGNDTRTVLNKYTQTPCANLHLPSHEQVRATVQGANDAFRTCQLTAHERGAILDRTADILKQRSEDLVAAMITEVGFTRADALNELARCMETFRLSADEARSLTGEMIPIEGAPNQGSRIGFTLRVPLGVVCAITPFNAPLNTVAHKVAPALAAGNAIILKPSTHTPSPSIIMAQALLEAGLPPGLVSVIHGEAEVVQWLLNEPEVHFYAFTGSTEVGRIIQQGAGLRRTQMELGSIAFTILADDANLDVALPKIVNAGFRKAGQVCTSIQNLLVHRSIAPQVQERLLDLVSALPYGDPADSNTIVGPVISVAAAERIESWIDESLARGATRLTGGARQGAVIPPTLLSNVDMSMPIGCREIFGPVMSIIPFDTLDEAIGLVNSTPFGLAAGLFTNRLDQALSVVRKLDVGGVHINDTSSSRVDLMPYGGSKDSGFGREGPRYAVREMSEERMVTIQAPAN